MAVYTYNSEVYPKISEYSDTPISVLGSYVVSEFVSSSSIYIISDDYGLITETTGILSSDYGSISTEEDVIEDYYTITITQTNPVFGFIKNIVSLYELSVTNSSVGGIQFVLQGGSYSSFGSAYIGYDLTNITGAATNIKNTESYVGSGSLFGFGSKAEKISLSYNESSTVGDVFVDDFGSISEAIQSTEDYGTVTESPTSYENYYYLLNITIDDCGLISSATEDIDSYGLVSENPVFYADYGNLELPPSYDAVKKPFGFIRFSGAATNIKNTESYVGSGSLFTYIGGEESITQEPYIGSGFISIFGSLVEKNTESYVGTGSLFSFNSVTESTGAKPQATGLFKFSGTVVQKNTESYVGSGSLFAYIGGAEATGSNPPESTELFKFSGAATNIKNTESYVGSGLLFGFGSKAERITFSYNESSGVDVISYFDYGLINEVSSESDDYGYVVDPAVLYDDYSPEFITTRRPFGLFNIFGDVVQKNTESYVGTGSLFSFDSSTEATGSNPPENTQLFRFSGSLVEKNTESYVGSGSLFTTGGHADSFSANPPENIQLFRLFGSLTESYTPATEVGSGSINITGTVVVAVKPQYDGFGKVSIFGYATNIKNTESYVGSGSAFGFVNKEERITFSYNESSVIGDVIVNDYGSISESITTSDDYGFITDQVYRYENYENLSPIPVRKPFGFSSFSGTLVEKNTESYLGSGSLFSYTGAAEAFGANPPESTELFKFSGAAVQKNTESYVGSGSAFGFVSKEERITFSYNESSVNYREDVDYGSIADNSGLTAIDYEFITDIPDSYNDYFDYGFVSTLPRRPFGLFNVSGDAYVISTLCYVGSGSLFAYTGGAEAFGANPPESTELFKFSGSAVQKNTESYVGKGSLFTYVSFTESTLVKPSATGLFKFSGSLVEKNTESYVGSGSLLFTGSANSSVKPQYDGFGKVSIFDSAKESFSEGLYTGSGSLFTAGGHAEAFIANPPENIQLFRFSGSLVEKNTESYLGSGSLFSYTGAAEAFGANPPESTELFKFSGSLTESYTPATEVGSGSFSLNRPFAILDPEDKIRLSNIKESFSFRPKPSTIEMSLTGELGIYFVNIYQGFVRFSASGAATIRTNPVHVGTGKIQSGGNCQQVFSSKPPKGSGSLFTAGGHAEAFIANPPENIQLFKFSGSSTESVLFPETGQGISKVDIKSLILINFDYPGKAKIEINGNSIELKSKAYSGKGKAEISGDAGVYFANKFVSSGDPIRVYANGKESTSNPHIGSGSLFGFVSKTEIFGANPPERTELFKISGSSKDKYVPSHTGSGIFKFTQTTTLLDIENKQRIVGSYESASSVPLLKTRSININGSLESERSTEAFVGSGSLFGFGSKTEIFGANPPERTELFKISGKAKETGTKRKIGSGSLFAYNGSAEVFVANPPESTELFKFSGASAESYTPATELGSGRLFGFSGASETTSVSETSKVVFEFTGSSDESINKSYYSKGSLFGLGGSSQSTIFTYIPSERAFRIFGRSFGSFAYGNYYGECASRMVGKSSDEKINYEAPKPTIMYII